MMYLMDIGCGNVWWMELAQGHIFGISSAESSLTAVLV